MDANRDAIFDLITAVNDDRRSLEAEALHSSDAMRKRQCERLSRRHATTVARITRDLARRGGRQGSLSNHQFETYIASLIDAYLDGSEERAAAYGATPSAPAPRPAASRRRTHK